MHSITELRNIKTKKYGWWRLDTFFKKDKFINLKIIDNGGWHFAEIKSPEEIYEKHKNDEHHDEYPNYWLNSIFVHNKGDSGYEQNGEVQLWGSEE